MADRSAKIRAASSAGSDVKCNFCIPLASKSQFAIRGMTDYQIIPDDPGRFAVKITFASGHSRIQHGFRTESDAKAWLESEREKEAARVAKRDLPT